jgi:hypothetical protein
MPRTHGAKDGDEVERHYTKHDAAYWTRPGLADVIQSQIDQGTTDYGELRDRALELGYSINSFWQTMSNLRNDGVIAKDEATGDYYNGDDGA